MIELRCKRQHSACHSDWHLCCGLHPLLAFIPLSPVFPNFAFEFSVPLAFVLLSVGFCSIQRSGKGGKGRTERRGHGVMEEEAGRERLGKRRVRTASCSPMWRHRVSDPCSTCLLSSFLCWHRHRDSNRTGCSACRLALCHLTAPVPLGPAVVRIH